MAWTRHGHQIPGTTVVEPKPTNRARCGATGRCPECRADASAVLGNAFSFAGSQHDDSLDVAPKEERLDLIVGESTDYVAIAKGMAVEYIMGRELLGPAAYTVYMESFTKVLDGWKGRFGTTLPDGMMYELTCNVAKREVYIVAYRKVDQKTIKF